MYVGKKVTRVDAVFYTQQLPTDVFFLLTHLKLRRYLEL